VLRNNLHTARNKLAKQNKLLVALVLYSSAAEPPPMLR